MQVLCNCGWLGVRRCHLVRSCVLGNGILDDRSLGDVRGDSNLPPKDEFLSILAVLGWNFWQMGVTHLRVSVQVLCNCGWLWVRRCHIVRSCVLGDGILDDSSLEDVRGEHNLSPNDDFLSNHAFLGWNFWQMGVTHLRVPVQVLCNIAVGYG